jgi:predicted permease
MSIFEILRQDLAAAARTLRRSPGFAAAAIATLALGIGANTAIFSLISATLIAPLPYPDADRIVQLWFTAPNAGGLTLSIPEINILTQQTRVFEDVAAYDFGGPGVNIAGAGEPEQVKAIHVSAAYFRLFGARVATGRTFKADEDRPGGGRVVALSHGLWVRRFNADPSLVGKTISLGNEPYFVTGILSADFQPDPPTQIWLPLQADPNSTGHATYVRAAARLRDGVSIDQANAQLKLTFSEFRRKFPRLNPQAGFLAKPLRETNVGEIRTALLVLFVAVMLVLLIACSNVANLLLARAVARQREIAIRTAMGASRVRLVNQMLTEGLLLSLAGALVGLVAGAVCLRVLRLMNPDAIPTPGASGPAFALDWRVLVFTAALCLGTTLLFGLLPALRASDIRLAQAMLDGGARTGTTRATLRTKSFLVVFQMAVAVVLVIGAGLMIRTFAALRAAQPGINPHRILTLQMSLEGTRFKDTASVTRLVEDGVDRLKRVPGVLNAATSWTLPVEVAFSSSFIIEGRPLGKDLVHGGALMRPVSPDYGSVFGIPVLRGRFFTTRDTSKSASVAVVSEAMAAKYWPRGNSIGQRITIDKYLGPDFAAPPREIIGVVKDVRDLGMKEEPASMIYVPQAQVPNGMTAIDASILPITWAVRTVSEPYSFRAAVQGTLKDASGGLAVARIRSMEDVVSQSTARSDFNTLLLAVFAAASLVLAAVGIYGLMVFSVQQRIHEIGIRLALGATGNQVRHLLISQGMRLAVAGVILGALASLGLARYMQTLVYSVKPVDIGTIFISSLTLGLVAAFACYIPTRRASRLDPATILRSR